MTATREKVVWEGAKALRPFLVPIADLEPFPGNPRRGDVEAIRESLRRFGQVKAVLTDAADGRRIVAHHHVVIAAGEEGWTHVAAIPAEFKDEEEARAYLLADNRTADRGTYDDDALLEQLKLAQERSLEGTGYSPEYAAQLEQHLAEARAALNPTPPSQFPPIHPGQVVTEYCCPSCGYEWSGRPKPSAENPPADDGPPADDAPAA